MRFLSFTLLLALQALVMCSLVSTETCIDKNAFMVSLREANPFPIAIFEKVQATRIADCGEEWKRNGLCCDPEDLQLFAELEASLIKNNREYLKKNTESLAEFLEKSKVAQPDQLEPLIKLLEGFDVSSAECWDEMIKVRSSGLCYICSGRSQRFFTEDKILINPETCEKVVTKCENFYRNVWSIHDHLEKIKVELNELMSSSLEAGKSLSSLVKDFEVYSPPADLVAAFRNFDLQRSNQLQLGLNSAKVCSMILNVRKTPYIFILNSAGAEAYKKASLIQLENRFKQRLNNLEDSCKRELEAIASEQKAAYELEKVRNQESIKEINAKTISESEKKTETDKEVKTHNEELKAIKQRSEEKEKSAKASYEKHKKAIKEIFEQSGIHISNTIDQLASNWNQERNMTRILSSVTGNDLIASATNQNGVSDPFTSDSLVLIRETDSLYTSFQGAKGVAAEHMSSNLLSLNTTLTFP